MGELTEVVVAVTGCSVTVKAEASLDEVAKQALDLYAAVVPADLDRVGPGLGFTSERRWSRHEAVPAPADPS
jgi:hypothetical protein